jgi:hypothetical protein
MLVMFERIAQAVDVGAAGFGSGWAFAFIAALVIAIYAIAAIRGYIDGSGRSVLQAAVVFLLALAGWWALDDLNRRDFAAERRVLEARAFELTTRALMPGSALACLDPMAGKGVEDDCEKAVFATAEATTAAVAYVGVQLSLLASANNHARRGGPGYGNEFINVRRSVEADRFGIVAHVLAVRDGCAPDQCAAFAFLQATSRISANLAQRPFDAYLRRHMADWQAAPPPGVPVAGNPPPGPSASAAAPKSPNNLYFPSSASIPPVNIMTAEPQAPPSHDTTGAAQSPPPRKPPPAAQSARPLPAAPPAAAAARSAPMQLSPGAQ